MEAAREYSLVEMHEFSTIYDYEDEIVERILDDFAKKAERQPWKPIKTERLAQICRSYARDGVIRDEQGLIDIAEWFIHLVAVLYVNTVLWGHTMRSPNDYLQQYTDQDIDADGEEFEEFFDDYISDPDTGQWIISDYALGPLCDVCYEMSHCTDAEELFRQLSKGLNIVHMRGDLSKWFVEGGKYRLTELNMI